MNLASIILGIIGLSGWILCILHPALAFIPVTCGILAIVLGIVSRKQAKQSGSPRGLANAGIVLGILSVIVLPLLAGIWLFAGKTEAVRERDAAMRGVLERQKSGVMIESAPSEAERARSATAVSNQEVEKLETTLDNVSPGKTVCVVAIRPLLEGGDPYVEMAKRMGFKPNLKVTLRGYDKDNDVYLVETSEGEEIGPSAGLCQRIYVRECK